MNENFINYTYVIFITPTGKGYGCFATQKIAQDKFRVAASFCAPSDALKFDKKRARVIASNRLKDENSYVEIDTNPDNNVDIKDIIEKVMLNSELNIPSWAYGAVNITGGFVYTLKDDNKSFMDFVEELHLEQHFFKWHFQLYQETMNYYNNH